MYEDLSLPLRAVRDLIRRDVEKVQGRFARDLRARCANSPRSTCPELAEQDRALLGRAPDLRLYGVEDEIQRALEKEVPLKSGGYLVIDQTEAMTTVDVNTGSFLGQRNLEETVYRTNLEAAQSVARQLRLRNLGGIIIIDFIDMVDAEHRRQVLRTLEKSLARDHAKTTVYDFSPLGLVEMTRKRTIESLERQLSEPCHECSGRGTVKTAETVTYEMFREIMRAVRQFDARAPAGDRIAESGGAHHRRGIQRRSPNWRNSSASRSASRPTRSTCRSSSMSCCSDAVDDSRTHADTGRGDAEPAMDGGARSVLDDWTSRSDNPATVRPHRRRSMTTPVRRRWRLLRRGAWYALAAALVLLALGNGIGSQLLPLVERHPDKIAAWLGVRVKGTVAFDAVETEWTRRGPLLRLDNLRIGSGANPLRIGDAEILVAQYAGMLPGRSFTELRVRGLDLVLQRDAAGLWSVRGLPGQQQAGGDPFETLERLGELQVSHARLQVLAPELGLNLRVPRIDLRMRVDGARILVGANAWLRSGATPIAAALDFDRRSGDGRVYAGTRQADLREFAGSFDLAGVAPASGTGRLHAWGQLRAKRIVAIRADAALDDVVVRGAAAADGRATADAGTRKAGAGCALDRHHPPMAGTRRAPATGRGRWRAGAGWRGRRWRATLWTAGTAHRRRAAPATARAGGRAAGRNARLAASLVRGRGAGRRGHSWCACRCLSASARIRGLHFAPVGNAPGMRGVDGWLQGDADGLRLRFDPQATFAFDWPAGFGVVHEFSADGEAVAWRDGNGWSVRTPGLALVNPGLQVKVRGGMGFPGDGTRPRIDLAADLGDVQVSMAHGFWVHHLMPKSTVQWLDAALNGGSLHDIHAVVTGDLDDWPFRTRRRSPRCRHVPGRCADARRRAQVPAGLARSGERWRPISASRPTVSPSPGAAASPGCRCPRSRPASRGSGVPS